MGNFKIWKLCTCHYTQIHAYVISAKTTICIYLVLFEELDKNPAATALCGGIFLKVY
jgi:hypothetical protein